MPKPDFEILGERENEFTTEKIVRINGDYFDVLENGGTRGAWQNRTTKSSTIDLTEARRRLIELGLMFEDIALATGAVTE